MEPASVADAEYLGPRLREADRQEVLAASGMGGTEALVLGVATSAVAFAIRDQRSPIAVFGIVDLGWGLGSPWLLGSDGVLEHGREFARRSRDEFDRVSAPWSRLTNHLDARNTLHQRWLSFLGFKFIELVPHYGVARIPFWRFEYLV